MKRGKQIEPVGSQTQPLEVRYGKPAELFNGKRAVVGAVPAAKSFHLSAQQLDPHAGGGGNERDGVPRADDFFGRFLRVDKVPGGEFAQFRFGIEDRADGSRRPQK